MIDESNIITAFASRKEAGATNGALFGNEEALGELAAAWPAARLVDTYNQLPGVTLVKKFTNRQTAVTRIWKALRALTPAAADTVAHSRAKARRPKTDGVSEAELATGRPDSKTALVIALLEEPAGATVQDIMTLTTWQVHSVRGFLSGALRKRMGLHLESLKREDGQRAYRIVR